MTLSTAMARLQNPRNPEYTAWRGFQNVYDAQPGFTNYAAGDYRLAPGNAYIDSGAHLTEVAASDAGSGTSLKVDDARFFWDGSGYPAWMGVHGDTIAVGAMSRTVQIARVDAKTNVLTLASPITRSVGDRIWLIRDTAGILRVKGSAPDVGALESDVGTRRRGGKER
jgi:hypothetical protein